MSYTHADLIADVTKEAEALRVHATEEERGRLDYKILNPSHVSNCIYGQMTGNCYSDRAAILINTCCIRYFKHKIMPVGCNARSDFEIISNNVNGATVDGFLNERTGFGNPSHFSAIEAYILLPDAKNDNLIAYLKGETDKLDL